MKDEIFKAEIKMTQHTHSQPVSSIHEAAPVHSGFGAKFNRGSKSEHMFRFFLQAVLSCSWSLIRVCPLGLSDNDNIDTKLPQILATLSDFDANHAKLAPNFECPQQHAVLFRVSLQIGSAGCKFDHPSG
jgi:hypothetical protein